jgi:hypothetical protein
MVDNNDIALEAIDVVTADEAVEALARESELPDSVTVSLQHFDTHGQHVSAHMQRMLQHYGAGQNAHVFQAREAELSKYHSTLTQLLDTIIEMSLSS